MPICYWNFVEKDGVTSCATTNSPTPIQMLGQPLIFGFETITCIQLVTTKSTNFFRRSEKDGQLRSYVFFISVWKVITLINNVWKAKLDSRRR